MVVISIKILLVQSLLSPQGLDLANLNLGVLDLTSDEFILDEVDVHIQQNLEDEVVKAALESVCLCFILQVIRSMPSSLWTAKALDWHQPCVIGRSHNELR